MRQFFANAKTLALSLIVATASARATDVQVPAPVGTEGIALHIINVDQGAASIVETPCGSILIDAGGRTGADTDHLLDYLKAYFEVRPTLGKRFAAVFLTHPHVDHDQSMLAVDAVYEFAGYIDDGRTSGDLHGVAKTLSDRYAGNRSRHVNEVTFVGTNKGYTDKVIDPLVCSGTKPKITVLAGSRQRHSWTKKAYDNPNNHSIVIRVDYGKASFLFLGDLETDGQTALVSQYAGTDLLDTDVLFVPHHGADNGTSVPLLAAITPKIAVISSGDPSVRDDWTAWDHGHPRTTTLQRLEDSTSGVRSPASRAAFNAQNSDPIGFRITKAIYDTAWDGDIVVHAEGDGTLSVVTHK